MMPLPSMFFRRLSIFFVFLIAGCVLSERDPLIAQFPLNNALWATNLEDAHQLALIDDHQYFVSHRCSDGKGCVSRIESGKISLVFTGLEIASGLAFDPRRGEVFVADREKVWIKNVRKNEIRSIQLKNKQPLDDLTFSIILRKAYGVDPYQSQVVEIDPKTNTASVVLDANFFEERHLGRPRKVIVSLDGTQWILVTNDPTKLIAVRREGKNLRVLHEFSGVQTLAGLQTYESFYVTLNSKGEFAVLDRKKQREWDLRYPAMEAHMPRGFILDGHNLVFLDRTLGSRYSVIRVPFSIFNPKF